MFGSFNEDSRQKLGDFAHYEEGGYEGGKNN